MKPAFLNWVGVSLGQRQLSYNGSTMFFYPHLKIAPPHLRPASYFTHTLHCFLRFRLSIRFAASLIRPSAFGSAQPTARKANTLRPAHLRQPGTKCAQATPPQRTEAGSVTLISNNLYPHPAGT